MREADERSAANGIGRTLAAVAGIVMLGMSASVFADRVYRYEEGGRTVYQDRAPGSARDEGHAVLNPQGVKVGEVLSREERRLARLREREAELDRIRDRALLATFTTEEDLVRTRDDRIGMIDGLISRLDDRIRLLAERLAVVDQRIRVQEASVDGDVQDALYAEQRSIQRNIENAWSLIDAKALERQTLSEKFEDDLLRYRELKTSHALP